MARLTRREWKAIRRRISRRPRRFSPSFINSQMNERNSYRNKVRLLQRNPNLASTSDFPYDVPSPIRVGSVVTALSKRYRIIQRGVVLSFDEENARYLVLFENREYGSEYCPDTEIASHGGFEALIPMARSNILADGVLSPSIVAPKDPSKGTCECISHCRKSFVTKRPRIQLHWRRNTLPTTTNYAMR